MARHSGLEAFEPTADNPWNAAKAAHLLARAGFGGTAEEIEQAVADGPRKAVARLLDFPDACADEIERGQVPDLSRIEGYPKTFAELRNIYEGKTADEKDLLKQRLDQANRAALRATAMWWVGRMVDGPYPLQEKLTLFWHGHFTTSARDERSAWLMWQQNETLRRSAAGNFRAFVRAVARDPAMIDYLNNQQNRKGRPNENFARELMELFTLGIGNYTEADIKEAARAFTGWAHDGEAYIFRKRDHDEEPKTFFGRRGNLDGDDVIDLILQHRSCPTYIASRLWRFFVSDELDPPLVVALGELLRENEYELRPVLHTLLTSRAFYEPPVMGGMIKSPLQLVVGTIRALSVKMPEFARLYAALDQMGQLPLMPPNVKGWPGGRSWINTSTLFVRQNTTLWIAGGEPIATGNGRVGRIVKLKGKNSGRTAPLAVTTDGSPAEIVDHWVGRLIQREIAEERLSVLIDAVGKTPTEASVQSVVRLILSMPEYQLC
jgi:hypothetical protein